MITYIGKIRPFKTFLGQYVFNSEESLDIELNNGKLENDLVQNIPDKWQKKEVKTEIKDLFTPLDEIPVIERNEIPLLEKIKDLSFDEIMSLIQYEYSHLNLKIAKTIKTKDGLINSITKQLA